METVLFDNSGGVQVVVTEVAKQVVYLDFDGAITRYNNEELGIYIDDIIVEESNLSEAQISTILSTLNSEYEDIIFVAEKPIEGEYSTVFIGATNAFAEYGDYTGLAESIDSENENLSDNAFVILDGSETLESIISTIAHEVEHIALGMEHSGDGLDGYAGAVVVASGVVSSRIVLEFNDSMTVKSGGSARSITLDGSANYLYKDTKLIVNNGGVVSTIAVSQGIMTIANKGYANLVDLTSLYAELYISAGGYANLVTVGDGANLIISAGGSATNVVVEDGGNLQMDVTSNTYFTGTSNGASVLVGNNVASNVTIYYSRYMEMDYGWTAYNTILNGSANYNYSQTKLTVLYGGKAVNTTVYQGVVYVSSGGYVSSTTLNGEYSYMYISSGAYADVVNVYNSGTLVVSAGGSATDFNIGTSSHLLVDVTSDTFLMGSANGKSVMVRDGVASNVTLYESRYMNIASGWTSYNAVLKGTASTTNLNVYSGGVASGTIVSQGSVNISSGGSANSTTLLTSDSYMTVLSGGVANFTTIESSGILVVSAGGSASDIYAKYGSFLMVDVTSDTYISGTYNGSLVKVGDNVTSNITLYYSRYMNLESGWTAYDTILNGSANTNYTTTTLNVLDGGIASNTIVSQGVVHVSSGGSANSTTLITSYGYMYVYAGGVTNNTTIEDGGKLYVTSGGYALNSVVESGGSLYVSSGATLTGTLEVTGSVYAYSGATIDFDLTNARAEYNSIINDYSLISGGSSANYSITIDSNLINGVYNLADNASSFSSSISIGNESFDYGVLTIDGESVVYADTAYNLTINSSDQLQLVVSSYSATIVTTEIGNATIDGMYISWLSDGSLEIHSTSKKYTVGVVDTSAWMLVGSGDFNGSGSDGLLWQEVSTGNVYIQNNLTSVAELTNKTNLLGTVSGDYSLEATGDFFGSGIDGALLLSPAFGDSSISLNYGFAVWAIEEDGTMQAGWLGALVNTWEESGDLSTLKGDYQSLSGEARLAEINANNYCYELVGVADFNGDGIDDVMLQNTMPTTVDGETITGSGDVFVFLTDTAENVISGIRPADGIVYTGCATDGWEVIGFGDFNGDGVDDVLLSDGTNLAGWEMADGQRSSDYWFGVMADGCEVVGIADFNDDGIDDILISDSDNNLTVWSVKDGAVTGTISIA